MKAIDPYTLRAGVAAVLQDAACRAVTPETHVEGAFDSEGHMLAAKVHLEDGTILRIAVALPEKPPPTTP